MSSVPPPREIIDFWLAAGQDKWFAKNEAFDAEIRKRFGAVHGQATVGKLDEWMQDAPGALALIILLDQFSRNLYRNDHRAFAQDGKALKCAEDAIDRHFDVELPMVARRWLYMPFMHSEDGAVQARGLFYFANRLDDPETFDFARLHEGIIRRFGRFPHRNEVLGRVSTPEEESFLQSGGFAG